LFALLTFAAFSASGQHFEVAAVRPHDPRRNIAVASGGGRFSATITLKYMIQVAYDLAPYQISGGRDWLDRQAWDVTAKAPGFAGEIPLEQLRPMLRELILDRFRLKVREAKQELPYFAMVVDKKGLRIGPNTGAAADFRLERGPALKWTKVTMRSFASWLQPWIQSDRVVLDETGLPGEYDLQLRWTGRRLTAAPDPQPDEAGPPDLFTALREQIGLRLESRCGAIRSLVVENAERPSEN
jgi:uncharacterized protein (TIGR03435 family)